MKKLRFLAPVLVLLLTAACAGSKDLIVLLPDENGKVGKVIVQSTDGNQVVLDTALASAQVSTGGAKKNDISQGQVDTIFNEALAAQPPKPMSLTLYFNTGGTVLTEKSKPVLKNLFDIVAARQAVEVQVTGHTDTFGYANNNDKLSLKRAKSVAKMLIEQGIKTNRVRAAGRGERELLVPTKDGVRESRNRRVEVIVR